MWQKIIISLQSIGDADAITKHECGFEVCSACIQIFIALTLLSAVHMSNDSDSNDDDEGGEDNGEIQINLMKCASGDL